MFNGHKRVHSLKFRSVTVPNGLIANLLVSKRDVLHNFWPIVFVCQTLTVILRIAF